ncbi:MAG: efflux RND transporter periplasmic adaptor subunit [Melioribacteraceae bacterium]|nr:efflux RND transporter periplasmic adaptor subunit [Melioribacteraceae bacterium]
MKLNKNDFKTGLIGLLLGLFIYFLIDSLFVTSSENNTGENIVNAEETIWTCSMHPQIRQSEPGDCPLCGMDLIPLSNNYENEEDSFTFTMSEASSALANVQTYKVTNKDPIYKINLTGKIAADERKLKSLTADFSGRIEKLYVDFTGERILKGSRLGTIYSSELISAQKELLETYKNKEVNPLLYNAVREKLKLWNLTEEQINSIEENQKVLTEIDFYSTMDGIVMNKNVSKGDYVNKGDIIFEIADLSSVWVLIDAYENDISLLKIGDNISFIIPSLPGKSYEAKISFIDPIINELTRTASVRAQVQNSNYLLKPGMFVNAEINSKRNNSSLNNSLLIPKSAVLWTGLRSVVYVKVEENSSSFEMREVVLGESTGEYYIVKKGLQENEEVVANGVFAVDAAAQLNGKYSMMNRPESNRIVVQDEFKKQLTKVVENYFALKNSLVKSNTTNAEKESEKLLNSIKKVDMSLLEEDAHVKWMSSKNDLTELLTKITSSFDLEEYRINFQKISGKIIDLTESFGINKDFVYVQFCPMAFDDKGAFWLSETEEILNPYFGDDMLNCGETKRKISSVDSYQDSNADKNQSFHRH